MINNLLSARKALSALVVGMAFCLLFACMTGTAIAKSDQKKPAGIYSEADLAFLAGRNQDAFDGFKRFIKEYPAYPEIVAARYKIAFICFNMGNFQDSINASMEWLNLYPDNPLKIEVMALLGNNYNALGDRPESFRWRLAAIMVDTGQDFQNIKEELRTRTIDLIKACTSIELVKMAGYSAENEYLPYIYHRLATIAVEEDRSDDTKKYAMLLVRSSQDETWVSIGRELLERVSKKESEANNNGTITVGCLLPLSGSFALYGEEVLNGIQLGMDIFKLQQEGRPIELVIKDTKGDAEETIKGLKELADDNNITVIVGPLRSGESSAAAKKAQELGVPLITFTQKDGITNEGDMIFRNFLSLSKEVEAVLNRAITEMGMKRFAVFYPDQSYGQYMKDLFRERVGLMGGTIAAIESYKPDQTDFGEGIKKLVGPGSSNTEGKKTNSVPILNFDAVFIPDNYQRIAMIAPQFPYYNAFNFTFLGTSLWLSDDLLKSTGSFMQGAIFPVGYSPNADRSGIEEFVMYYKDAFQSDPGVLAANGYDTIRLIRKIFNRGDIKTRKDFQNALFSVVFDGVTGEISFDQKGEVKKEPLLLTIEGEEFRVVE